MRYLLSVSLHVSWKAGAKDETKLSAQNVLKLCVKNVFDNAVPLQVSSARWLILHTCMGISYTSCLCDFAHAREIMVLQLKQWTFCWGEFYLRYQKLPKASVWIEHSKLSHLKCSLGLLGVESSNPNIHMSMCNEQKLLWHYFCFHSHPTMLVSCQSPWTCGTRLSGTRMQTKTAVYSEETKVHLKQSLWTNILNPQALAVLTAVFYHINVSCVFRQLKIEAPCVTHSGCCSASRISVHVLAHLKHAQKNTKGQVCLPV